MRFSFAAAFVATATLVSSVTADLYNRLNWNDTAVLFIDHQTGLFSIVQDYAPDLYYNNVVGLAEAAKYFNLPVVLTTSRSDGPNGPMLPEITSLFPDAPIISRPGQINAWDNEDFVKAVKKTGKKQLVISGIVTDVCVTFVSLAAKKAGYEVFVVTDASGTFTEAVRDASWLRMQQGGVQLMNYFGVVLEIARDWRIDLEGIAALFHKRLPTYARVMDSYNGAVASVQASS